ncbi:MAG: hypothetical protein ABSD68_02915 [Candidatus Micrarchaeales archaeon]|jgi:hypothetical protein
MSVLYNLLVQTLPILLGITFMLIINAMRFRQSRIRIKSSPEMICDEIGKDNIIQINSQKKNAELCEFEKEARDRLIENGCMRSENFDGNVRKIAFDNLGIIECGRLKDLRDLVRQSQCRKLCIFVKERKGLLRYLLHFGPSSGVLLSYLVSYKVEVFGA